MTFHGPNAVVESHRPYMLLRVSSITPPEPVPVARAPASEPGEVLRSSTTVVEATCDGGAQAWLALVCDNCSYTVFTNLLGYLLLHSTR